MESIDCIICNSSNLSDYKKIQDTHDLNTFFNLSKCDCGFIFLNPRPDENEISKYYDELYLPHTSKKSFFNMIYNLIQKVTFFWKWAILRKKSYKLNSLLDIGGGSGNFSKFLKNKGVNAYNYDPYFKNDANISTDRKYDVITLWHSLEHIHDIKKIFSKINSSLSNKGVLYIAIPNHDAYERSYFEEKWVAYDTPRHLYHFNPETISTLLNLYGFCIIKEYSMLQDTAFNIFLSKKNSILKKYIILVKSIFMILFNKKISSSLLYVCRKK